MEYKTKIIKQFLKPFKVYIYRLFSNHHYKKINLRNINVLFIVQRTECFTSSLSIYNRMIKDPDFNVSVLALPRYNQFEYNSDSFMLETLDDTISFCKKLNGKHETISGYDFENMKYIELYPNQYDYIFINIPYDEHYPTPFKLKCLNKTGRLCYLPYGYNSTNSESLFTDTNPLTLIKYVKFYFSISNIHHKELMKKMMWLSQLLSFPNPPVKNYGYPRFDLINPDYPKNIETLLWCPRWETDEDGHEHSSFMKYKDFILQFAKDNPRLKIIIRPHPLMFGNHIKSGKITEEDLNKYIKEINNSSNIFLDESSSYEESVKQADIIITDFTGLLVEMFLQQKIIFYTGSNDGLREEYNCMLDSFYHIENERDIAKLFTQMQKGEDVKKKIREDGISEFWSFNKKNASERIVADIKRRIY